MIPPLLVSFSYTWSHSHTRAIIFANQSVAGKISGQLTRHSTGIFTNDVVASLGSHPVCAGRILLGVEWKSASLSVSFSHRPIIKQCYNFTNFNNQAVKLLFVVCCVHQYRKFPTHGTILNVRIGVVEVSAGRHGSHVLIAALILIQVYATINNQLLRIDTVNVIRPS